MDSANAYSIVVARPAARWERAANMGEWFDQLQNMPEPLFVATRQGKHIAGDGVWSSRAWIPTGKSLGRYLRCALLEFPLSISELRALMLTEGYERAPSDKRIKEALEALGCTFEKVGNATKWDLPA